MCVSNGEGARRGLLGVGGSSGEYMKRQVVVLRLLQLYLLEVTPLLSLDLPLYILGDLLSLSLSEPARGVPGASASIDAPAEAEAGGAPRTAVFAEVGERVSSTCAGGADQRVPGGYCSGGSSTGSLPLLRWSVPLCLGQKPSPRLGHSMVYAEPHLILYGGKDGR